MGKEITPDYICKIEGHGSLDINFKDSRAKLNIHEGERLFEGLLMKRLPNDAPFITARICGICPTVHYLTAICALENALGIKISQETEILRKILLAGQIIQSHTLHLYFLALPDYLNLDSGLDLFKAYPAEFHIALNLKKFADRTIELIGGRAVHPITPQITGFDKIPSVKDLNLLLEEAKNVLDDASQTVALFAQLSYPELEHPTEFLSLSPKEKKYPFYNSDGINSSLNKNFATVDYDREIEEIVKSYSTAKFSLKEGKGFMVGALARLNLNKDLLNPGAKDLIKKLKIKIPSYNPFHNNLAQAIEILHFLEEIINLIKTISSLDLEKAQTFNFPLKKGYGVAACEAPRGTLYHAYTLDENGLIKKCNIITPTAQNLTSIEEAANILLAQTKNLSNKKRQHLLEMLIRAYDPCITCSVH